MPISAEAISEYEKAVKLGKKEGELVVALDDILKEKGIRPVSEVPLGLVQIPMELIAGTKTAGRSTAFSKSFYPLLKDKSEFAQKWVALYGAHLQEGIHDPIKAYEYMNKFYVEEGNKRVSVLKCCGAVSVPGVVTRLVPPISNDPETIIYYEFMEFYALSEINFIWFTKEGSFAKLQRLVGKRPDETWNDDDRLDFSALYYRFEAEFNAHKGWADHIRCGDAFLYLLGVYDYHTLLKMSVEDLKKTINKVWEEFQLLRTDSSLELRMDPAIEGDKKKSIISKLIPTSTPQLRIAFIHEKKADISGWTYNHELGRMHLEEIFGDQILTTTYTGATPENALEVIKSAIEDGNTLIFTTSPPLFKASLQAAIDEPQVKILNCSLNTTSRHVRTYYARMYEAKFLMGAIAGAMSSNGKLGYIADYPIYGMTANINAFALGAKMVNPRAKVYLEWSTVKDQTNIESKYLAEEVRYISGVDIQPSVDANRHFGLYRSTDKSFHNLAMPVWNRGKVYEQMVRNVLNGTWKQDEASDATKGLNYWWGMSTGLIDVLCSHALPIGTVRLIDLLKETICRGDFHLFSGVLYAQDGAVQTDVNRIMTPEEIVQMDWLAENVIGSIPVKKELEDRALPVVTQSGLSKTEE